MFSNSCDAAVDENSPIRSFPALLELYFLVCVAEVFILRAALPVFSRSYEACCECLRLNLFDCGFFLLSFVVNDSDIIGAGGFLMET